MCEQYEEWTSCQMYGHAFQQHGNVRFCSDCGESYTEDLPEPSTENGLARVNQAHQTPEEQAEDYGKPEPDGRDF